MAKQAVQATTGATTPYLQPEPDWFDEAARILSYWQPQGGEQPAFLDVDRVTRLLRSLAEGNYRSTALLSTGFSRQHQANWKVMAERGNLSAMAVLDAMEKAESWAEQRDLATIGAASRSGPQYWTAAAWRLERTRPDRYALRKDETQTPRVVVQIGSTPASVTVSIGDTSSEPTSIIDVSPVENAVTPTPSTTSAEVSQLTEGALSDTDTLRINPALPHVSLSASSGAQTRRGTQTAAAVAMTAVSVPARKKRGRPTNAERAARMRET